MAKRIYDQTLGQLAGVQVTTDGLGNIVRDGTEAYAQMTVSASGQPIASTAGTGNLVSLSGATVTDGSISFTANAQYAIIDTQGFEGASFTITGFGTATLAVYECPVGVVVPVGFVPESGHPRSAVANRH